MFMHPFRRFVRLPLGRLPAIALTMAASFPAAPACPAAAQEPALPRVLILTTGGTIASRAGGPMVEGPELVQAVPAILEHARVTVEEFSRVGSSQMTPDHWVRLATRVNRSFAEDTALSGVVITHGTDTLEETAFFLNLTVRDVRPVVLVGSMRSSEEISADGPANLLNAVRVAVHPDAVGSGVLVVLNEDIAAGRDVWKTDNRRVGTFRSPELGFLGFADPDRVVFYRSPLKPHTHQSDLTITNVDRLPEVEIVSDYAGFDGRSLHDALTRRPDGIVLSTFAGGRMSAGARAAVEEARGAVPIVVASRVPGGRIVGAWDDATLVARDLPAHKARILLMLALTGPDRSTETLQRVFDRY